MLSVCLWTFYKSPSNSLLPSVCLWSYFGSNPSSGPLEQRSQCGCHSRTGVDELAAPCQVPPEVFSLPQTDLPKSEGIALEMFSPARCFCRCLFYTQPCSVWWCTHCFLIVQNHTEIHFRTEWRVSYSYLEQCFHNVFNPFFLFFLCVAGWIQNEFLAFLVTVYTKHNMITKWKHALQM